MYFYSFAFSYLIFTFTYHIFKSTFFVFIYSNTVHLYISELHGFTFTITNHLYIVLNFVICKKQPTKPSHNFHHCFKRNHQYNLN